MKKRELNNIAKDLARANKVLANAISLCGSVARLDIVKEIMSNPENHNEEIKYLAERFLKHSVITEFTDARLYGADLDDFTDFGQVLNEQLENM